MKCAKIIWPFSFRSILVSGAIRIFLNPTKMFCDRHQVNKKGCSLAAPEVISHLSSLAKKKKGYWVRNIATLDKNILTGEIT